MVTTAAFHPREIVPPADRRLPWIDRLKALALLWIFLDHASERTFGDPYFGNPDNFWPTLHERIAQLAPLHGFGGLNPLANLVRYVGWVGDAGVGLFLLLSGFALVWSSISAGKEALRASRFYRRRLDRVYPLWIAAHVGLLFIPAIIGVHVSLIDPQLYWSVLGVRVLPSQFYYGWSAWWFMGLILQLYFAFPFLCRMLQRWGPLAFLLAVVSVALVVRTAGLFYFTDYLDCWSRGAIFVTRLPEFAVGMVLAVWMHRRSSSAVSSLWSMLPGSLAFSVGTAASFTLGGMAVAPLLQSVGLFLIFFWVVGRWDQRKARFGPLAWLDWIGRHSLSLYLVHQPFVRLLTHHADSRQGLLRDVLGGALALLLTTVAAIALEKATGLVIATLRRWSTYPRKWPVGFGIAGAFALAWAGLILAELHVRQVDPQEAGDLGWGERPSLRPDPIFGWTLLPDRKTRLRWQSYDYVVTANHLGFPGPDYPEQKPAGVYRVLVTGDAFTSAEGVDTDLAWPRLLENQLSGRTHQPTQVMNFAITGYGPNQYKAVVNTFAPRLKPDLILIGLFINDYGDVLTTDDEFRRSIGFGKADPDGIAAIGSFRQLASLVRTTTIDLIDRRLHRPNREGYFLGHFHFLERGCDDEVGAGGTLMAQRLGEIKTIADSIGAKVMIAMIPSGPQVCPPDRLAYWPEGIDLSDAARFDPDLPQRTTAGIASRLGIPCFDLRASLRAALTEGNPYQSQNMHWTALGHRTAAAAILEKILTPGGIRTAQTQRRGEENPIATDGDR